MEENTVETGSVDSSGFHVILRSVICFVGITVMALGIALTTRAQLGATPLSSIPYVASIGFEFSIGFFTGMINLLLIAGQILILRRRFPLRQYWQIPASCVFGYFIDVWMGIVPDVSAAAYGVKFLQLALGTLALGVGIFLEVSADVVMMAGEGAVKTLVIVLKKDFGFLKSMLDLGMVAAAALLSLAMFRDIHGIREGTFFSAIFVGLTVKLLHMVLGRPLHRALRRS